MTIPILPESAPFRADQRAWLNGFIAGVYSLDGVSVSSTAGTDVPATLVTSSQPEIEDDYPWHDPVLALDERLALAEGKPFTLRLMASMAQLDCGTCGYDCHAYAQAIADGEESSLSKCTPGGKETTKKLKELVAQRAA